MSLVNGNSQIKENIFENRFMHVAELRSLGMGKLFGPGTPVEETLNYITNWVQENRR